MRPTTWTNLSVRLLYPLLFRLPSLFLLPYHDSETLVGVAEKPLKIYPSTERLDSLIFHGDIEAEKNKSLLCRGRPKDWPRR